MSVIPFPSPMASARPVRAAVGGSGQVADREEVRVARESRLALWRRRWRGRRLLAALEPDQIRDADLDPFAVRREAMKPFWRA